MKQRKYKLLRETELKLRETKILGENDKKNFRENTTITWRNRTITEKK